MANWFNPLGLAIILVHKFEDTYEPLQSSEGSGAKSIYSGIGSPNGETKIMENEKLSVEKLIGSSALVFPALLLPP